MYNKICFDIILAHYSAAVHFQLMVFRPAFALFIHICEARAHIVFRHIPILSLFSFVITNTSNFVSTEFTRTHSATNISAFSERE